MITIQDLYNILDNKIANEAQKALISNNMPPQLADRMCAAIDRHEKAELFKRILYEYNEWLLNQKRQQSYIQQFLSEYYK
jgi:uncharacterized protein YaaW (UPF0174 family)